MPHTTWRVSRIAKCWRIAAEYTASLRDAPLIAGILTAQVAAAAVTLPIVVAFAL